jgi:hypothetical protein
MNAQYNALYPDVTVLASDDRSITIEFRPNYFENQTMEFQHTTFELPQFKFGVRAAQRMPGMEDLQSRVINLAVPGYTGTTVAVVEADYETVNGFSLAPIPQMIPKDNLGAAERVYVPKFVSQQEFYPKILAAIQSIGKVKGWITANVIVTPLQYQSSTKTLRKYSRIVVRVEYGGKENLFDNTGSDEWARASLINYSIGKRWAASLTLKKSSAVDAFLTSGLWFKMEVAEDGMYKIDATYLRSLGVEPSSLSSITDIKIFGSNGRMLPETLLSSRPADLPQCAVMYVDKNSNGKFNDDDYILFYGQGTTGWNYDPVQKNFSHYINIYSNSNYYFLAVGANAPIKTVQQTSFAVSGGSSVTTTLGKVFFKEEKFNFNQSGQNWVSTPLNANGVRTISNKLYGWVEGTSIKYVYSLFSRSNADATFIIEEPGTAPSTLNIGGMTNYILDSPVFDYANTGTSQMIRTPNLFDSRSNLKITYQSAGTVAQGFIDWLRIFYQQKLTADGNQLLFHSPDTSGVVEYYVDGFTSNDCSVFDISDVNNVRTLSYQTGQLHGSLSFSDSNSAGQLKRYWVGTPSTYKYPKSFIKIPNSNLHGFNGAEFIVITPAEFKSEAVRLKSHKESLSQPISTVVVDIDTLFNEFGFGITDPVAMRDFIKYAVDHWTMKPKYVLLFGDASYDHKLILGNDKWWVPTIQTSQSNNKIYTYNNEDFFSYLDQANQTKVSIAVGRLCPRSVEQARVLVDKIIGYEKKSLKSNWKNTITIVADDLWSTDDQGGETFNTSDSEILASSYTPKDFEIRRIYTEEYPLLYASSGRKRPEARQAILDQVNNGTLILNYAGHGNPKVWAHEAILTYDDVKTQFFNNDRLTFIVAATCDWGRFDEAGEQSSAEEVMIVQGGGAIGVLSATRAVYADRNAYMNQQFYTYLLNSSAPMRFGDAYLLTKNAVGGYDADDNEQKYFLLGDPTVRLVVPEGTVTIDSLNGKSISVLDTVKALEKIVLKGTVRDLSNAVLTSYNGTAAITVYDAERSRKIPQIPTVTINETGTIIYRGEASINNGLLNAEFVVPKDIAYDNKNGRISLYFSNTASDGRGYTTHFIVGGTNNQAEPDSVGPEISIYFDTPSFRSGDVVSSNTTLIVELHDKSGINSSANSIGHRLEAWIDESAKSIDLTDSYKGQIDSYQTGTAEYRFNGLNPGTHTIKVRAWDVYNNSSIAEAKFTVSAREGLSIYNVYNFPNPLSKSTTFTFQHNQLSGIDVTINIYTVAGRLIHSIHRQGYSERFFRAEWDGRDSDGNLVGNGIYLYKVAATTADGKYSSESLGKLAIVR